MQTQTHSPTQWTREQAHALLARLEAGEKQALPEFRALLKVNPEIVTVLGTFQESTRRALMRGVIGQPMVGVLTEELLVQRCAALQAELEGPNPTPLERLLCEHIANCWLALFMLETAQVQTADGRPPDWKWREHDQWLRDRAQARYLAACTTLARVRKLLRPHHQVQVNIAEPGAQQMNIAGS